MYCKKCGMKVLDGDPFCSACGEPLTKISHVENREAEKHKTISIWKLVKESFGTTVLILLFFDIKIYVGVIIFIVLLAACLIYEILKR